MNMVLIIIINNHLAIGVETRGKMQMNEKWLSKKKGYVASGTVVVSSLQANLHSSLSEQRDDGNNQKLYGSCPEIV